MQTRSPDDQRNQFNVKVFLPAPSFQEARNAFQKLFAPVGVSFLEASGINVTASFEPRPQLALRGAQT